MTTQSQEKKKITTTGFVDKFIPPDEQNVDEAQKYQLRNWWSVIQANKFQSLKVRADLYERALKYIPSCYKIWYNYLVELIDSVKDRSTLSKHFERVNQVFERALKYLMRMPKIWLLYVQFLKSQDLITKTRQVYDQALRCLPVTQHELIWESYSEWALQQSSVSTAVHIMKRFIKIDHGFKEQLYDYLIEKQQINEAAHLLHEMVHDEQFSSQKSISKYQYYIELCELILKHPEQIKSIDCEKTIREGISKYVDEVGNLWVKLSEYYIKFGKFKEARSAFEEALTKVMTVRDFSIVYNAYLKFEEELVYAFNEVEEQEFDEELLNEQMNRLEELIAKRPYLLVEVELRVNPHSVKDWMKKIALYADDQSKILNIYGDAVSTIDPQQAANGQLSDIWESFASYYYKHKDYLNGNRIFQKGVEIKYKSAEDLIRLWCYWAEQLVKEGFYQDAIQIAKLALFNRNINQEFDLHSNLRLWTLYVDLEINFGTFDTVKQAYRRMLDLKVITPQMLLNFAQFLEQNNYFEESFKVFESGLAMFKWPGLYDIWLVYINKFVKRYQRDKLERARDLFEKVLQSVPQKFCKIFYLMYAEYEEQHGLLNHAFEVYDRMVANIEDKDKLEGYLIYIGKVSQFLGIIKTRPIFEAAMNLFKNEELVKIGLKFAQMEKKFEEIDRVRAIYQHISQFVDPKDDPYQFWTIWYNFEMYHGNEDTNLDFDRIKRTVKNKFALMPVNIEKVKAKAEKELSQQEQQNQNQPAAMEPEGK